MTALSIHRLTLTNPLWFRVYGVLLIALGVAWLITFVAISHGFHSHELWPATGLITAGSGLLSRERWRTVCSSALLAFTGLLTAAVLLLHSRPIDLLIAIGVAAFSVVPTLLCIRQWRTLA